MTTWVCADCGTAYDEKVSPCTQCASERIARLEDETEPVSDDHSRRTDIEWRCSECGATHIKNNPPCNRCGNMSFEAVYDNTQAPSDSETNPRGANPGTTSSPDSKTTRQSMFYIGAILGVFAVLFLPFFFFLVALPEAVLQATQGKSVLDSLSEDARDNPAMKGSFLIFRWFGNFLLLLFALGVVLGVLIAL